MHPRLAILALLSIAATCAIAYAADRDQQKPAAIGTSTIHLPKGWVIKSATATALAAHAPASDKDDPSPASIPPAEVAEYSPAVSVTIQPFTGEIDPAVQQKILASVDKYRTVEKTIPITVGDAKGYAFGGTFAVGKIQLRSRHYLLTANNKLYVIAFTTLASRWADHQAEFDASAKSFIPGK